MKSRFVEATQGVAGGFNHGKFMIARFDREEWIRLSEMDEQAGLGARSLLARCGWTHDHVLVFDLQTGEGALFRLGGSACADLRKHAVWVCPMFEPFLEWLYEWRSRASAEVVAAGEDPTWFGSLPTLVELPGAPAAMVGYRRPGPDGEEER